MKTLGAVRGRLEHVLPQGFALPVEQFDQRHRVLVTLLWMHALGLSVYALWGAHNPSQALLQGLVIAVPALGASLVPNRTFKAVACSLGLVFASSVLVHLSNGQIEAHFHYFVVIALVTLYQMVWPYACASAWVLLEHGVVGVISPHAVYNHESAWQHPWVWAGIHAAFIAAASAGSIATWKANEVLARRLERTVERQSAILDSAAEGVILVGVDGNVGFANKAARRMLGRDLTGHPHVDMWRHPYQACPVCLSLDGAKVEPVKIVLGQDPGFPAEMAVAASGDPETPGVVVTFHDRSERESLSEARQEVQRLGLLEAAQRREVIALQGTLRPRQPSVPGVSLGVHYVPAEGAPVGGDFYDWVVLPGGELQLAVVDVLGKGLAATKDALAVMHTLRTLSLEGVAMEDLVIRADALLLEQTPDLIATLVVVRYCPGTGDVLVAGASHPPVLLVRRGGEVVELDAPGLAIGYPSAGSLEVERARLEPGDTLVMYTDGLIEGTRDIIDGLARLGAGASEMRFLAAADLARELVLQALSDADRTDDSLALVLRREVEAPAEAE